MTKSDETTLPKHVLHAVQIVFGKEPADHPWLDFRWRVLDMLPRELSIGQGQTTTDNIPLVPLRVDEAVPNPGEPNQDKSKSSGQDMVLYTAQALVELHHAEAEAYAENLNSAEPSVFLVLRPDLINETETEAGMSLIEASFSPYNIQDYEDCGEDLVMKLPLIGAMRDLVRQFVDQHYHPEEFKKRQRDRIDPDAIYAPRGDDRLIKQNDPFAAPNNRKKLN